MPKVTYDVSGDIPETQPAPVGWYRAKIIDAEEGESKSSGNPMITIKFQLTKTADGTKINDDAYWPVRYYLMTADDRPYALRGIREFVTALNLKLKGSLDTTKLKGKEVQLKLKADTDQDDEYQPRIAKILALNASPNGDAPSAVAEPEPEEPEAEAEAEAGEEEGVDLDALDRVALKRFIKEEELGIVVNKGMTDDAIRAAILEAMGGEEEAAEPEAEAEEEAEAEPEAEDDGYDEMSRDDLLTELKERKLATNGAKAVLIKRLRADDASNPFD